jgi:hypothetical protein
VGVAALQIYQQLFLIWQELNLYELANLTSVENFPSIVELDVFGCPKLKRIGGLSKLHKIKIVRCPNMEVLESVALLDSLELGDANMETLPGYLQAVNPRYLDLICSKKLCTSIKSGSSPECHKINHIAKHDINCKEDSHAEAQESSEED